MKADDLTPVWKALSDPVRRSILDALRVGPRTTGDLCDLFETTRFAVMKHLAVLYGAGLIAVERRGRERWNALNAVPIRAIYERWVRPYEGLWAADLLRLKQHIEEGYAMADAFGVLEVKLEITIEASPSRVWAALVDETTLWWRKDFYTSPKTKRFVIEPRLGGKAYEDFGDGAGLVWYSVIGFEPPVSLRLAGYLFPEFGGRANCLLHITLEPQGRKTILKLHDCIFGQTNAGCGTSIPEGWKMLFEESFKAYVEGKAAA